MRTAVMWQQSDSRTASELSGLLAQDIGEREKKYMKRNIRKITSTDMPMGKLTLVSDFLPPPKFLMPKDDTVKITLKIDAPTIRFFKGEASKNKTKYQRMMREVLSIYAKKYGADE